MSSQVVQPGTTAKVPLRAGVYGRQSHGNKRSISEQFVDGQRDARNEGYTVVEEYVDTIGASRFSKGKRKDWPRLIDDIEAGLIDAVVLWETSRGSREPEDWLRFLRICRERGVLIRVVSQDQWYDMKRRSRDWKQLADDGIDNAYQTEQTSERTGRTFRANAEVGRPHGQVPFGHRRIFHPTTGEFMRQEPDASVHVTPIGISWSPAGVVAELFTWAIEGVPIAEMARRMDSRGIPSPRLHRAAMAQDIEQLKKYATTNWNAPTIRKILTNEQHLGSRVHRDQVAMRGAWPALVEADTFWSVHNMMNAKQRHTGGVRMGRGNAKHLLSFIVHCPCGHPMAYALSKGYPRYQCQSKGFVIVDGVKKQVTGAKHASIAAYLLESYVTEWVLLYLTDPETVTRLDAQVSNHEEVARARVEKANLEAELEDWKRRALDSKSAVTLDMFEAKAAELAPLIADAERRTIWTGLPDEVRDLTGGGAVRKWAALDNEARRRVIRAVVSELSILPTTVLGRTPQPAAERVVIR